MPFICWGAAAQPGHPHRLPHFVFAEPVTAAKDAAWPQVVHAHQHTVATAVATAPQEVQQSYAHATDVAGQATPAISAITLLTLVFVSSWQFQQLSQLPFPVELGSLYIRQFVSIPLTPPPRLCS